MSTPREVELKFRSNTTQPRSDIGSFTKAAKGQLQDLAQDFAGGAGRIGAFAASLGPVGLALGATAGAAIAAGGAVFSLANHAAEVGARFHDLSLETGLTVETLSGLENELNKSGATLEDVSNAVFIMQKNLNGAADGSKNMQATFRERGITDFGAALKDTDGTLRTVLKSLGSLRDEGERNAKGAEVFGKAYKQLRVFIAETGGDIDKVIEKAKAAGLVMSTEAADAADEFGDSLDELKLRSSRLAATLGSELIPAFNQLFRVLSSESQNSASATGVALDFIRAKAQETTNGIIVTIAALKTAYQAAGVFSQTGLTGTSINFAGSLFEENVRGLMKTAMTPSLPRADSPGGGARSGGRGGGGGKRKADDGALKDIQADQAELDADFRREGEALERDYRRRLDTLAQFTEQELSLLDMWIKEKRSIFDREEKEVTRSTKNEADRERKLRDIQAKRTTAEDEYARRRNAAEDKLEEGKRRAEEASADKRLKLAEATAAARISAIEQVTDSGVKKESQAAEEIGAIQLDLHDKQAARLRERLAQEEEGSAEYRRIQADLGAAEIERAALVEATTHRVAMAKKAEVEAERERLEALRRLRAQATAEGLELDRGFIGQAAREDAYRTRAERIATVRQLAEKDREIARAQHKERLADIEQEYEDNLKKAKNGEEYLQALKIYNQKIENEMRRHQLALGQINKGEDDDVKAESPFKVFEDLWGDFKDNAANAEDSIGGSVQSLSETVVGGFRNMERALKQGIAAHYLYGESLGLALKKALAAELANLAAEFHVQGIRHAAYALGSLAFGDFRGAALHGAASAAFFAAGTFTGKLAGGLAESAGMRGSSGASGGRAVASTASPTPADRNFNYGGQGATPASYDAQQGTRATGHGLTGGTMADALNGIREMQRQQMAMQAQTNAAVAHLAQAANAFETASPETLLMKGASTNAGRRAIGSAVKEHSDEAPSFNRHLLENLGFAR